MKKTTTEDTVMYYFESRKGAHDDVKSIEFVENKNMYLVTFENKEGKISLKGYRNQEVQYD